jgi:hypothetical protein
VVWKETSWIGLKVTVSFRMSPTTTTSGITYISWSIWEKSSRLI